MDIFRNFIFVFFPLLLLTRGVQIEAPTTMLAGAIFLMQTLLLLQLAKKPYLPK